MHSQHPARSHQPDTPSPAAPAFAAADYFQVFQALPAPALLITPLEGEVIEANEAWLAEFHYTRAEALGHTLLELGVYAYPGQRQEINEALAAQGGRYQAVIEFRHRDGRTAPYLTSITSVTIAGRTAYLAVANDVSARQKAEAALSTTEANYRRIVETAQEGIFVFDAEWRLSFCNARFAQMLGYGLDEILGRPISEFILETDRTAHTDRRNRQTAGQGGAYENQYRTKTGTPIWLLISVSPMVVDGRFTGSFGMATDITENKLAEAALRESEEKFKYIFDHSVIGKSITFPDGRLTVNRAYCNMLGYAPGELDNEVWQRLTHPDDLAESERQVARLLAGEAETTRFTKRYLHKNGATVWAEIGIALRRDEQGRPLYFITAVLDITERKLAEARLQQSEARYRSIVENALEGLIVFDAAWQIAFTNARADEILGFDPGELLGQPITAIILDEDRPQHLERRQRWEHDLQGRYEACYRKKDGTRVWAQVSGWTVTDGGQFAGVYAMVTDITERKLAEEVIQQRNRMLLALHQVSLAISADLRLPERGANILEQAQVMLDADRGGALYLVEPGQHGLRLVYGSGLHRDRVGLLLPADHNLVGRVYQTGRPLVVNDYTHWEGHGAVLVDDSPSAVLGVPLVLKGQVEGVLTLVANSRRRTFEPQDIQWGEMFAAQAAIALQNSQLYEQAMQELAERERAEAALRESEESLRITFQTSPDAFVIVGETDARLVEVNEQFVRLYGYPREEALGRTSFELGLWAEPERRAALLAQLAHADRIIDFEVLARRKNGETFPVLYSVSKLRLNGRPLLLGVVHDISERKLAEQQVLQLNRLYSILTRTNEVLGRARDRHELFTEVCRIATADGWLRMAWVGLTDPATHLVHPVAAAGHQDGFLDHVRISRDDVPDGRGPTGTAIREDRHIICRDIAQDPVMAPWRGAALSRGYRASAAFPLRLDGQVIGALTVYAPEAGWFSDKEVELLDELAADISFALHALEHEAQRQRAELELRQAYDETIVGWSRALDLRDKETEGHSQRVTELTLRLAARLGLPPDELVHVRHGALLHDIGKMGVPDAILRKPDALDADELAQMRRHPQLAYELLAPIRYLQPALDIPYHHHERWDGAGYPHQLKGAEIPLAARIFAIVDVWDALTSDRPYRPAWSRARTLAYIREQAGSHFDPAVTEAFLAEVDPPAKG